MSHSYIKLFTIPGSIRFSAAAFLGRLPAGMIGFAVILPLSQSTGSYASAGLVAACVMLGMALCAPFSGRWVDRHGQQKTLLLFALLNVMATLALIFCAQWGASLLMLCLAGVASGASRLSTGTLVRTRWAYVIETLKPAQREGALQAAYAFEAVVDEVVFISAPILVTLLCTAVHPLAGLGGCLVSYGVGAVALAMQWRTQPKVQPIDKRASSAWCIAGFQVIFAAIFLIGISAGAVEVLVVARADAFGSRSFTGLLMATLAFSSILSGFWYGARSFQLSLQSLWIRCLGLLVLALLPFAFATTLTTLVLSLFFAGLLIAPTSIAGQVLTKHILPAAQLNEGMNMVVTAMILGMATGGWLAGFCIDTFGVFLAGWVPVIAIGVAFVMAQVSSRRHTSSSTQTSSRAQRGTSHV